MKLVGFWLYGPVDDMRQAALGTLITIGAAMLLANEGDPDRDSLTIVMVSSCYAVGGSVALSRNEVGFTPAAGFAGMARCNYDLVDTNGTNFLDGKATLEPSRNR